jgi:superfamily II RNA helicase
VKPLFELDLKALFPFELDDFQKQAIAALEAGKSLVVCAPTGSGKTAIAEYAAYRAVSQGKRAFYTTPLKALSNQKFRDFQEKLASQLGEAAVGLITGDIVINPDAPLVVMTTEIFRNMLYETPIGQVGTSLEDVETVILDECHYISDRGRGTVWEESIVYCPPTIQLVALSATIGNPQELTDWINQVRQSKGERSRKTAPQLTCQLINSDHRPVPLRFYFYNKDGLFPLLNGNQTGINPKLKGKQNQRQRLKRSECPSASAVLKQLQVRDLLPAIYVIFSRRGCERSVEELEGLMLVNEQERQALTDYLLNFFLAGKAQQQEGLLAAVATVDPDLHRKLLEYFAGNPGAREVLLDCFTTDPDLGHELFNFLALQSEVVRPQQVEPLLRGIAAHHAGILPVWKELVEQLFEAGLVKVVFATATLSAGINMPARTTVISALSRRTDDGHSLLTPSEFLQISGRAGRRGMDAVGHVVAVQTPVEGAVEAAFLATAKPDSLRSCFTPSYSMVLNLLQKHSLAEVKDLLEKSFAEYLAQLKLDPQHEEIASLTAQLAKLDVQLAGLEDKHFASYEKLNGRLKAEQRLLKTLQQQAANRRREEIAPQIPHLPLGSILYLKSKHLKVSQPLAAALVAKVPGPGQSPELICLGADNYWYAIPSAEIIALNDQSLPANAIAALNLPDLEASRWGRGYKGGEATAAIARQIAESATPLPLAPEVAAQQAKVADTKAILAEHPLAAREEPAHLLKQHRQRLNLREQLHNSQVKYRKLKSSQAYYWEEFLSLIEILREFAALEGFIPTPLGEAAATIRGENELWLGIALMSGTFDRLEPPDLAAAISAIVTDTMRPDSWTNYAAPPAVIDAFQCSDSGGISLREARRRLIQVQSRYGIAIPAWLEVDLSGIVAQWALAADWRELWENSSLDEGDIVRLLRRAIDLLSQIPQIPNASAVLRENAREAMKLLKRFPV